MKFYVLLPSEEEDYTYVFEECEVKPSVTEEKKLRWLKKLYNVAAIEVEKKEGGVKIYKLVRNEAPVAVEVPEGVSPYSVI